MATLLLQSAVGSVSHAMGGPVGALVGKILPSLLKQGAGALLGGKTVLEGPRLTNLASLASTEGAPIPRLYGRARLGGQMIWATRLVEIQTRTRSGGSGGKSQVTGASAQTENVTYSYAANLAVGLCEGEIAFVRRIWADGKELDRTTFTHRLYTGTQTQMPDPLIVAKEGAAQAPAYRGLAYIVFENFPLADFGNRIPQFSFEIVKPVAGLARAVVTEPTAHHQHVHLGGRIGHRPRDLPGVHPDLRRMHHQNAVDILGVSELQNFLLVLLTVGIRTNDDGVVLPKLGQFDIGYTR